MYKFPVISLPVASRPAALAFPKLWAPCLALVAALFWTLPLTAQSFLAHPQKNGPQRAPDVAIADDGTFLVAWSNDDSEKIEARFFNADGTPGSDVLILGNGDPFPPTVGVAALNPGFIVVWDAPSFELQGRYVSADGVPSGDAFLVLYGYYGAVASNSSGDFVVSANSYADSNMIPDETDPDDMVVAKRYRRNQAGEYIPSDPIQVNVRTVGLQTNSAVDMWEDGTYVVAWELNCPSSDPCEDGDDAFGVRFRRFKKNSDPITSEIKPHDLGAGLQLAPDVFARPDGTFVMTWDGQVAGADSRSTIWVRGFSANGSAFGPEEIVPTSTDDQLSPSIAGADSGELLIVWDDEQENLQGRLLDAQLGRLSDELPLSGRAMGERPHVDGAGDRFWIAWSDVFTGGADVYLDTLVVPLFEDDFESEGTSKWSSTTP